MAFAQIVAIAHLEYRVVTPARARPAATPLGFIASVAPRRA